MTDRPAAPFTRDTAPPWMTFAEVAATLNVSEATVAEAVRAGTLTAVTLTPKTPRIPREAIWSDGPTEPLGLEDRQIRREVDLARVQAHAIRLYVEDAFRGITTLCAHLEATEAFIENTAARAAGSSAKRKAA